MRLGAAYIADRIVSMYDDVQKNFFCVWVFTIYISMDLKCIYMSVSRLVTMLQASPCFALGGRVYLTHVP